MKKFVFNAETGETQERDLTPDEIAEFEASFPPSAPEVLPIPRLSFWLAVSEAEIGVSKASVRARIDAMPDGKDKDQALYYFEDAQQYRRDDPLLNQVAALEGISQTELDHLWTWALANYA